MAEKPIHLIRTEEQKSTWQEASVKVPVWITQSSLEGIEQLIAWADGFESAKGGQVPGKFELVMFHRTIRANIIEAKKNEATLENKKPAAVQAQEMVTQENLMDWMGLAAIASNTLGSFRAFIQGILEGKTPKEML